MLLIILIPVLGLALAYIVNKMFPKAQFRGYDLLPFFFYICMSLNYHAPKKA